MICASFITFAVFTLTWHHIYLHKALPVGSPIRFLEMGKLLSWCALFSPNCWLLSCILLYWCPFLCVVCFHCLCICCVHIWMMYIGIAASEKRFRMAASRCGIISWFAIALFNLWVVPPLHHASAAPKSRHQRGCKVLKGFVQGPLVGCAGALSRPYKYSWSAVSGWSEG